MQQLYDKEREKDDKINDLLKRYHKAVEKCFVKKSVYRSLYCDSDDSEDFDTTTVNYEKIKELENNNVTEKFIKDELMSKCGLNINILNNIIFKLKALKNPKYFLSQIIVNPYNFINIGSYLLTFDRAEKIRKIYSLNISLKIRCKKWIYFHVLNSSMFNLTFQEKKLYSNINSLWIPEKLLNKKYKEYFKDSKNNELIEQVKTRLCIKKIFDGVSFVTTKYLYNIEKKMGDMLIDLYYDKKIELDSEHINNFIKKQEEKQKFKFSPEQIEAIKSCASNKFNIICGYPGTGKTTITNAVLHYLTTYEDPKICLTSHTGLATTKLKNAVDKELQEPNLIGTLTKLIYNTFPKIKNSKFTDISEHSDIKYADLKPDIIVVDEVSMVDMLMFYRLIKYCYEFNCDLILLGDNQQLRPIGPGNPLRSLIDANKKHDLFNVSYLTNIKRQNGGILRDIILNMNKKTIRERDFDNCSLIFKDKKEFIYKETTKINEHKFKDYLNSLELHNDDTHFITPQGNKLFGYQNMNKILQDYFNPIKDETNEGKPIKYPKKSKFMQEIRDGDKVMRTVNDYTDDIIRANGDTGIVELKEGKITKVIVKYHNKNPEEELTISELYDNFIPFYCNTVHKSQGSEYKNIVIFISDEFNFMLTRDGAWNLIYTAISRAKDKCIIIGDMSMFEKAQRYKEAKNITVFLEEFNENELSSDTEE